MALRVGLTHTKMKIGRAKEHFDGLKAHVSSFLGDKPYTVSKYDDPAKSFHITRIELTKMRDEIGTVVGDFAFCLRSALDHLAWQLALLTTDNPSRNTCFPIYQADPTDSDAFRKAVWDIPCEGVAIIKALQPYHRGAAFKDDPLWQLNKLCNIDKHRLIAVSYIPIDIRIDGVSSARRGNLKDAVEIAIPIGEKENLQLSVKVPGIVFGEPIDQVDGMSCFEITIDGLGGIYDFVTYDVVPRFAGLFPQTINP